MTRAHAAANHGRARHLLAMRTNEPVVAFAEALVSRISIAHAVSVAPVVAARLMAGARSVSTGITDPPVQTLARRSRDALHDAAELAPAVTAAVAWAGFDIACFTGEPVAAVASQRLFVAGPVFRAGKRALRHRADFTLPPVLAVALALDTCPVT